MRSIGGACTSAQLRVFTLCNQLQEVSRSFASFIARLPAPAAAVLRCAPSHLTRCHLQAISKTPDALLLFSSSSLPIVRSRPSLQYTASLEHCTSSCRPPLEALEAGTIEVVLPLVRALVDKAEALVLRMHEQDFGQEGTPAVTRASAYISDLARHLSHSRCARSSGRATLLSFQNQRLVILITKRLCIMGSRLITASNIRHGGCFRTACCIQLHPL